MPLRWDTAAALLADTSAWVRVAAYRDDRLAALDEERIVICAMTHLKSVWSAPRGTI